MATEENKALTRRFYEEVFNNKHMAGVDAFVAPHIIDHSLPPGAPGGIESVKQAITMLLTAFPDLHLTLEDLIAEGDRIAVHWTMSGTHLGASLGMPPTGKQFTIPGVSLLRLESGKAVEAWIIQDQLSMLQQLGLAPMPAQAAS
jgi:steroid delta-isomerase-like uncharacterized protein